MTDRALEAFRAELEAAGLRPNTIKADGNLYRCPVEGKPNARDGAYKLHGDDPPAGWYMNWVTGAEGTWTAERDRPLSDAERRKLAQRMEAARKEREAERARGWARAAERARAMLAQAEPCNSHPYLDRKGVKPCPRLVVEEDDLLLIPVLNPDGEVQSLQTIAPDGNKRFMTGGKAAGGYFPIKGDDAGPLLVCEGLATGLSLKEATGATVLVAFTAGNLEAVARLARDKCPERSIVICGDDDRHTAGNPGRAQAEAAARAVDGRVALPRFSGEAAGTDFNDLHQAKGLKAVRAQVASIQTETTAAEKAPVEMAQVQEVPGEKALPESDQPEMAQEESDQSATERKEADQGQLSRLEPSQVPAIEGEAIESQALPGPPTDWPFRVGDGGVFKRIEKENRKTHDVETEWVWVCSRLEVLAETRDAQGQNWGRLLAVHTREGEVNQWAMPMELLAGSGEAYRAELLNLGLLLAPDSTARHALHEYISTACPSERARCVERLGWHGAVYVLPNRTFGGGDDERVLFQVDAPQDHQFQTAGTLTEWQELAKLAVGNSRLVFGISAAFAAPLLHLVGAESGGFHFRGGSSIGKTTALLLAGSVWGGGGINGYCRNWRATSNGLETVAALHCDALLCLDEMGQVDGREAGATAYMLANGQGKTRARRNGSARPPARWRVLFLSTGEISLADKMRETGGRSRAGQEVRLVDLPADAGAGLGLFQELHDLPSPGALADHLRLACQQQYGTAAQSFLEVITDKPEGLAGKLRQAMAEFVGRYCPAGADGQVKRVAERFGLVSAAGTLATAAGILLWPDEEAVQAAAECFGAWLEHRGGTGPHELEVGVARVREFIQTHGASRFQPWADQGERPINNRAGYVRGRPAGREYLIFLDTFINEVCAGLDAKAVARELVARELMIPDGRGYPARTERLPDEKTPCRMYVVKEAVLGEGGQGD